MRGEWDNLSGQGAALPTPACPDHRLPDTEVSTMADRSQYRESVPEINPDPVGSTWVSAFDAALPLVQRAVRQRDQDHAEVKSE